MQSSEATTSWESDDNGVNNSEVALRDRFATASRFSAFVALSVLAANIARLTNQWNKQRSLTSGLGRTYMELVAQHS